MKIISFGIGRERCLVLSVLLWGGALLPLLGAAAPAPEAFDGTWRHPRVTIPKVATPPVVDGTVTDAEWAAATLFPALLSRDPLLDDGVAPYREEEQTRIWMCYTDEALYAAVRQGLPQEQQPAPDRNSVYLMFEEFHFALHPASNRQRRLNDAVGFRWQPAGVTYASRPIPGGWEGEIRIPFAALDRPAAPADGAAWRGYFYSQWYKVGQRMFAWPYVQWRQPGESQIRFGGAVPGVWFAAPGQVALTGPGGELATRLVRRPRAAREPFYYPDIISAIAASTEEGGTFKPFEEIIADAWAAFEPAANVDAPGQYLLRYDAHFEGQPLAQGVESFLRPAPVELDLTPYYLRRQQLQVQAATTFDAARTLRATLAPVGLTATAVYDNRRAELWLPTADLPPGEYQLTADTLDADGALLDQQTAPVQRPPDPLWWTAEYGLTPLIPPPWTPVVAEPDAVEIWGRRYTFSGAQPLPAQIVSAGAELLAGPIMLRTATPWQSGVRELVASGPEAAQYRSRFTHGQVQVQTDVRVEFDGFMLVDLELTGAGELPELTLEIPLRPERARLTMSHWQAPGPGGEGDAPQGYLPPEGFRGAPHLVTWIGDDERGLELTLESTRGWSVARMPEAIQVLPEADRTLWRIVLIDRPVRLEAGAPRRIRLALTATPTKAIMPYVQRARNVLDYNDRILTGADWTGYHAWHPPVEDPEILENMRTRVAEAAARGHKLLINGGWHISMDDQGNRIWTAEMLAQPPANRSFGPNKQYAGCYNSPYAEFMVNSWGHNARRTDIPGIRFDTVTPFAPCNSLAHGCGWHDAEGALWPSYDIFAQREIWKRLYRIFHGGEVAEGLLWTATGGSGPGIAAVHSFSDLREVAEGFFQKAETLKEGYDPGYLRANMRGYALGCKTVNSIKFGPLFYNERIGALLLHDADPRFFPATLWRNSYAAHAIPALAIWEAWDWVDRPAARFVGWWAAHPGWTIAADARMILGSLYQHTAAGRGLLVVTNYEPEPYAAVPVRLDPAALGLPQPLFAEDAITREPLTIEADGTLRLDLFRQRYRLIQLSAQPPRYHAAALGPELLADPPALITNNWTSAEIAVAPESEYVLSAEIRLEHDLGAGTNEPNVGERWGPRIKHVLEIYLDGQGIEEPRRADGLRSAEFSRHPWRLQHWEATAGWTRIFLPVETGADAASAQVNIRRSGVGEFQVRAVSLRQRER